MAILRKLILTVTVIITIYVILILYNTFHMETITKRPNWWYSAMTAVIKTDDILTITTVASKDLHDKWIVVTTINHPTEDIARLANITGWKLLVVGDTKTPHNWSYPGTICLGVDTHVEYQTAKNLPLNSYTRKNIGYLYAIHHGAKYIYDTDDDNHPTNGRIEFLLEPKTTGLIYQDRTNNVMNPYAHFGQPTIWPRGYPLELINYPTNNTYKLCSFSTPTIQQGLVNKDPDVDAIFRLTRKKFPKPSFNVTFDSRAPPLILPKGIFAPFNSQNTLFTYDALWALFLPTTVNFRVTDIWRGYWAQRLMWLLGQKLAFFPPNAIQIRNPHNYLEDFQDENQVYLETNQLLEFLKNWECFDNSTFFDCVRQLSRDMVNEKFWREEDAILIETWLSDLKRIGYKEPSMVFEEPGTSGCDNDTASGVRTIYFSPVVQNDITRTSKSDIRYLQEFCSEFLTKDAINVTRRVQYPRHVYDNILLVIIFNFPYHNLIPLLDTLYFNHFPNIVYCSETTSFDELQSKMANSSFPWTRRNVTFVNIEMNSGYFGYECAMRAIEMNYNVDGYLIMGDDVLFNVWNFDKLNLNESAYPTASRLTLGRETLPNETYWVWWNSEMGYNSLNQALNKLEKLLNTGSASEKNILQKYFENLNAKYRNDTVTIALSDIYYVPKSKTDFFLSVIKVFYEHRVFTEIAVPTVLDGMQGSAVGDVSVAILWGDERQNWVTFYDTTRLFTHPVKLTEVFLDIKAKQTYCKHYIEKLVTKW